MLNLNYRFKPWEAAVGGLSRCREDVQADAGAHFRPFVVLLGQHGADEPDQGVATGEDPTTSGGGGSRG